MKDVCIVIPIYKTDLPELELKSLKNYINIFAKRDKYVICPLSLDISQLDISADELSSLRIIKVNDCMFGSVIQYSRLCTLADFYLQFTDYNYMLIALTDAWVYEDLLDYWMSLGYDYIGAPWCHLCASCEMPKTNRVGNGGLSLRNVLTFILKLNETPLSDFFPEDLKLIQQLDLNLPTCDIAVRFAVENKAYEYAKAGILSMGWHNVYKLDPEHFEFIHKNLEP